MGDGQEIAAAHKPVGKLSLVRLLAGVDRRLRLRRASVFRRRRLVAYGRHRAQISCARVEIAGREHGVERGRHDRRDPGSVRPDAADEKPLQLGVGPVADAGVLVRCDLEPETLKAGSSKTWLPPESARERSSPCGPRGVWQLWQTITLLTR